MSFFSGSHVGISHYFFHSAKRRKAAITGGILLVAAALPFAVQAVSGPPDIPSTPSATSLNVSSQSHSTTGSPELVESTINSNSSDTGRSTTETTVTVNGKSIDVPQDGSVNKVITSQNGSTNIDVNVQRQSNTTGSSRERNSLHITTSTRTSDHSTNQSTTTITDKGELQP